MKRREQETVAESIYRQLMAGQPLCVDDGHDFDRHVLASVLAISCEEVSSREAGSLSEACGLSQEALEYLSAAWFCAAGQGLLAGFAGKAFKTDDEVLLLVDLLSGFADLPLSPLMATLVARRAMQDNHLWQDLGLRNRAELSRLLFRHFPALAAGNTQNMKWKKYFYRALCEAEGSVLCTAPTCRQCTDFSDCFGSEDGESRMAYIRNGYPLSV
ncbi:nitrogen fixation protein NifQ [Martelella endophytica]|uniref:nitrogen fixation protein NifQ n=1 Tax=Martelella endophytica TaxID=1486262 RepID=UPI000697FEFF|nr:nitrogen fixation protein NifQ [Martelella endophytica]